MRLSIIIVSYNVRYYLEQCLFSVRRASRDIEAEVWVVDNHSSDGSLDYLRARFPEVRFIANIHNVGFSRANNIALRQCLGEYVLLLNPDTIVAESTLVDTLRFMDDHADAGCLGVRMLNVDGTSAPESRRGIPSPMTAFYKMTGLCRRFPDHPKIGHYYMGGLSWDSSHEIEIVSGAFCLMRHSALSTIGLLDEDFFMYGEDIDLSYRLLQASFHNYYYPSVILHYKGESTRRSSFRYVHVFYEAMLIFLRKHYSKLSTFLTIPIKGFIYLQAIMALLRMLAKKARKSLGFFPTKKKDGQDTTYVFIGKEETLRECRNLARVNGLDASYVVGTEQSLPRGHLSRALPKGIPYIYMVYDTSAYAYETILHLFAESPKRQVFLATYNPDTKVLITHNEIMR